MHRFGDNSAPFRVKYSNARKQLLVRITKDNTDTWVWLNLSGTIEQKPLKLPETCPSPKDIAIAPFGYFLPLKGSIFILYDKTGKYKTSNVDAEFGLPLYATWVNEMLVVNYDSNAISAFDAEAIKLWHLCDVFSHGVVPTGDKSGFYAAGEKNIYHISNEVNLISCARSSMIVDLGLIYHQFEIRILFSHPNYVLSEAIA